MRESKQSLAERLDALLAAANKWFIGAGALSLQETEMLRVRDNPAAMADQR